MKQDKLYDFEYVTCLIDNYINSGGDWYEIEEGVTGWGLVILQGYGNKTFVIREVGVGLHTIDVYRDNEVPKIYMDLIEEYENMEEEEA